MPKTPVRKCWTLLLGICIGLSIWICWILVTKSSFLVEFEKRPNLFFDGTSTWVNTTFSKFEFTDSEIPQDLDIVHKGFFRIQKTKFYAWKMRSKRQLKKFQQRIFCIVFVSTKRIALEIMKSWGPRCDTLFMYSSKRSTDRFENEVQTVFEKSGNIRTIKHWHLVIGIFKEINLHRGDSEWFIKIDQNFFLIVENLHILLKSYDFSHPLIFGHFQKLRRREYISLRNGCLMSKEAIKRIGENDLNTNIPLLDPVDPYLSYDLEFEKYTSFLEIKKIDSRDSLERLLFLPLQVTRIFYSLENDPNDIYDPNDNGNARKNLLKTSSKTIKEGYDCCSDQAILIPKEDIINLEYMLYRVIAYGISQNYSNPEERDK